MRRTVGVRVSVVLGLLLVGLLGVWGAAVAEEAKPKLPPFNGLVHPQVTFFPGEIMEFNIRWMGIRAGRARWETVGVVPFGGRECFHLRGTMESSGLAKAAFEFVYLIEAYVDAHTLEAVWSYEHFDTRRIHVSWATTFKPEACSVSYNGTFIDHREGKYFDFDVEKEYHREALQGFVAMQTLRFLPVVSGTHSSIGIFQERRSQSMDVLFGKPEAVKCPAGRYQCDTYQVDDAVFSFSQEMPRYLVKMKAKTDRGSFSVELTRAVAGKGAGSTASALTSQVYD